MSSSKKHPKATKLRFHGRIFEHLEKEPVVSSESVDLIAQREAACGVTFPASIKEWFSIEGVFDLFREHTNADELVTNERTDSLWQLGQLGDPEEVAQGYLRVAVENQGVVGFYVKLDGSEDPPVFHNNDDWSSPLDEVEWVECTETFSEFLYAMMVGE